MKKIGILDTEGKELNPLTGTEYTPQYLKNVEKHKWNKLPMYTQIKPQKIIKSIIDNQVIILESGTGSGAFFGNSFFTIWHNFCVIALKFICWS